MKSLNSRHRCIAVMTTSLALSLGLPLNSQALGVTKAFINGKPNLNIRMRAENVAQDSLPDDANALTVRTRLGYTTGRVNGLSGFVEMESVTAYFGQKYNNTFNGKTNYPVVADPTGAEINQANLSYTGISDTLVKWGRQRLILDNARFVGNVGWRQNEQTLDSLALINTSLTDTKATYAYVYNVNGITGGDNKVAAHIVNASYSGLGFAKLTGYGYLLDFVDTPARSQQTIGLRFTGAMALSTTMKLLYTAEYANQSAYQDGASTIDANYMLGELGATVSHVNAKLGYEVLGGDGAYGFSTPLATKHAFNGWSDQFLATPLDGLQDLYISLGGKVMATKLMVVYHNYTADNGSADYGTELNFLVAKKLGKNYSAAVKYARYSADTYKVDTNKLWLQVQLKL